jgi:hypothetical protein
MLGRLGRLFPIPIYVCVIDLLRVGMKNIRPKRPKTDSL